MSARGRPAVSGVLAALALIATAAGLILFFPFARCSACAGKGVLMAPADYSEREKYTQECGYCRTTGHVSMITKRAILRDTVTCRNCRGRGMEPAGCGFDPRPPRPCGWCDGARKTTAQRVRQFEMTHQLTPAGRD